MCMTKKGTGMSLLKDFAESDKVVCIYGVIQFSFFRTRKKYLSGFGVARDRDKACVYCVCFFSRVGVKCVFVFSC